jgi:hypothetical protein
LTTEHHLSILVALAHAPRDTGSYQPAAGVAARKNLKKPMVEEARSMWDTCAVDLRVRLPRNVAAHVEEVQKRDPDILSRIVLYAVTRRTIFDHLATRTAFGARPEGT